MSECHESDSSGNCNHSEDGACQCQGNSGDFGNFGCRENSLDCSGWRPWGNAATGICPGPCQCEEEEAWNLIVPPRPNYHWVKNFMVLRRQWSDHARKNLVKFTQTPRSQNPPPVPKSSPTGQISSSEELPASALLPEPPQPLQDDIQAPESLAVVHELPDSSQLHQTYQKSSRNTRISNFCCQQSVTTSSRYCHQNSFPRSQIPHNFLYPRPASGCLCQPMPKNGSPGPRIDVRAHRECTCECPTSPECACPPSERRFAPATRPCHSRLCYHPRPAPGPSPGRCRCTKCLPPLLPCDSCSASKCPVVKGCGARRDCKAGPRKPEEIDLDIKIDEVQAVKAEKLVKQVSYSDKIEVREDIIDVSCLFPEEEELQGDGVKDSDDQVGLDGDQEVKSPRKSCPATCGRSCLAKCGSKLTKIVNNDGEQVKVDDQKARTDDQQVKTDDQRVRADQVTRKSCPETCGRSCLAKCGTKLKKVGNDDGPGDSNLGIDDQKVKADDQVRADDQVTKKSCESRCGTLCSARSGLKAAGDDLAGDFDDDKIRACKEKVITDDQVEIPYKEGGERCQARCGTETEQILDDPDDRDDQKRITAGKEEILETVFKSCRKKRRGKCNKKAKGSTIDDQEDSKGNFGDQGARSCRKGRCRPCNDVGSSSVGKEGGQSSDDKAEIINSADDTAENLGSEWTFVDVEYKRPFKLLKSIDQKRRERNSLQDYDFVVVKFVKRVSTDSVVVINKLFRPSGHRIDGKETSDGEEQKTDSILSFSESDHQIISTMDLMVIGFDD